MIISAAMIEDDASGSESLDLLHSGRITRWSMTYILNPGALTHWRRIPRIRFVLNSGSEQIQYLF